MKQSTNKSEFPKMNRLSLPLVAFVLITADAVGSERAEYFGSWVSTHPLTRGESNTLDISEMLEVKFVRDFGGSPDTQRLEEAAKSVQFIDDILIVDLTRHPSEATYKLVLSVFENPQGQLVMEGTAYMYLDGIMVNGMHLAFRKVDD